MTTSPRLVYKLTAVFLAILALAVFSPDMPGTTAQSQTEQGKLSFSPSTVKDGGVFTITLTGGVPNTQTRLWVKQGTRGYEDFGLWEKTDASGNINVNRTLNCNAYTTLEPGKSLPVGNKILTQAVYLEYEGTGKVSAGAVHAKDCRVSNDPPPVTPGTPRCQFTSPFTSATHFLQYPLPASYSTTISKQERLAPGASEPDTLPIDEFKLEWAAVVDRVGERNKYDFLTAADGYTAELTSSATGSNSITPINQSVALAGSLMTKIKDDPIKYTLVVKKNGAQVATCSVDVKHTVSWIEVYKPPEEAQPTGNSLFPYKVKDILGRDYVTRPFPTAADFSSPIKRFVGRYYDFTSTPGRFFDWGNLGYWPGFGGPDEDGAGETSTHIVMAMRPHLLGWKKSTFISRLENEPLLFFRGNTFRGQFYDAFVPWDTVLQSDPDRRRSGMYLHYDEPCRLTIYGVDIDDRGYIYYSQQNCAGGLVIARDSGSALVPAVQILSPETAAEAIAKGDLKVKVVSGGTDVGNEAPRVYKSGTSYYLVQASNDKTNIFNVTDPYNPTLHRADSGKFVNGVQAGNTIAVNDGGAIKLYEASGYINGMAPQKEFPGIRLGAGYRGLAADKTSGKFFSIYYTARPEISNAGAAPNQYDAPDVYLAVFAPGSGGYTETRHSLASPTVSGLSGHRLGGAKSPFIPTTLEFHNGFLMGYGRPPATLTGGVHSDMRLWVLRSGKPVELDTKGFIQSFYTKNFSITSGFTDNSLVSDLSIYTLNGKDYLFVNVGRHGDVFELDNVSRDGSSGNPTNPTNPNPNPNPGGGTGTGGTTPLPPPPPSDSECFNEYRNLCDQVQRLKQQLCTLMPESAFCQ